MTMMDLTSPGLPTTLAEPFSQLEHAFRRMTRVVQDMSQEELEYTGPADNINSTAMLIAHTTCTEIGFLYTIKGEEVPPDVEAAYGPYMTADGTLPKVSGRSAEELLERHRQVQGMVRAYLSSLSDADATREVKIPWWSDSATVRYVLWHMAAHSMFHQGQIARLREWYKLRGA